MPEDYIDALLDEKYMEDLIASRTSGCQEVSKTNDGWSFPKLLKHHSECGSTMKHLTPECLVRLLIAKAATNRQNMKREKKRNRQDRLQKARHIMTKSDGGPTLHEIQYPTKHIQKSHNPTTKVK